MSRNTHLVQYSLNGKQCSHVLINISENFHSKQFNRKNCKSNCIPLLYQLLVTTRFTGMIG